MLFLPCRGNFKWKVSEKEDEIIRLAIKGKLYSVGKVLLPKRAVCVQPQYFWKNLRMVETFKRSQRMPAFGVEVDSNLSCVRDGFCLGGS